MKEDTKYKIYLAVFVTLVAGAIGGGLYWIHKRKLWPFEEGE